MIKKVLLLITVLSCIGINSCNWLTNPDDNPNRPKDTIITDDDDDDVKGKWDNTRWGKSKWN